jgi:sensor histidine kinase regulating citrate/malate metabolism
MSKVQFKSIWQSLLAMAVLLCFYFYARVCMFEAVQERLMANAAAASLALDAELLTQITQSEDSDSAAYKKIHGTLQRLVNLHSDIAFVYTMRQNQGGQIEFVVDSQIKQDANGDGVLSATEIPATIGQLYPEATEDLKKGFQVPSVDSKITTDSWGRFLSGYAPIHGEGNKVVGLVGVDMRLDQLDAKLRRLDLGLVLSLLALFLPFLVWSSGFKGNHP